MGKQNFGGQGGFKKGNRNFKGGNDKFKKGKPNFKNGRKPFSNQGRPKSSFKKNKTKTFDVEARLVVRNLSFKTTEESLKQHFEPYGRIAHVKLLKRPSGDLVGCGFIQYECLENANMAIANTNKRAFLGRAIEVELSVPKDKFVANRDAARQSQPQGQDWRGDGDTQHEEEELKEEVKSEPESDGEFSGRNNKQEREGNDERRKPNKRDFKDKREPPKSAEKPKPEERLVRKARLIVRNISFKVTEESLRQHFEPHGEVQEVTLLKKPNGDLVGCGFVQYKSVQAATKAILQTNAKPFLGRPIHVDWAVAKNKYMSHVVQQQDEEHYLKNEVKEEPLSEEEDSKQGIGQGDSGAEVKSEPSGSEDSDDSADQYEDADDDSDDGSDTGEEGEEEDLGSEGQDDASQTTEDPSKLKVSANDAEDGRTVFLKNVSFSVEDDELQQFVRQFGEVQYALVCVDKLTEHSKGTAFVRFKSKEDADMLLSCGPDRLTLSGQLVQPMPAMLRDRVRGTNSRDKQPRDSRNLYLIKEGVILAGSKAAVEVSASDMAKRLSLEQNKSQMLRNLNRFVSRYRLTIHNLPPHYTDEELRRTCLQMANVKPYALKECRVMRHLKGALGDNGKHISKGYGFVMFTKHEDALACLRRMNNNPSIFDKNNRPIVAFSIEDKVVINARKKRLEKSKIRNPLHKRYVDPEKTEESEGNPGINKSQQRSNNRNMKRKSNNATHTDTATPAKKTKFDKKKRKSENQSNTEEKKNPVNGGEKVVFGEYGGETAKPGGSKKMRSKYHLRVQAEMHKENVKKEKKKQKMSKKNKKFGTEEKVKQPKQKQNTNKKNKQKVMNQKDDKSFNDLVNKYKSKLVEGASKLQVKRKWYEQS